MKQVFLLIFGILLLATATTAYRYDVFDDDGIRLNSNPTYGCYNGIPYVKYAYFDTRYEDCQSYRCGHHRHNSYHQNYNYYPNYHRTYGQIIQNHYRPVLHPGIYRFY